ncbi:bacterial regulatory s, tetR family protein [Collimonas fungivorans]|jgi:AcrR family transcriptional regulator|uniref:Bacterial regulatory s, tetR family protein n=1 Tax=Collimonas fungivorans TaxID=158899 RepID=A0A127PCN8_9BURK|nr:TetR/AcrR family transcriptional regulator [Collimonas fungivorans]AMO95364.1 bacterial regulatory s, tetR family protein [Collimonas fungivorans]
MRKIDPVKHEQKRRDILEAAGRCFAKDGFRGASISSICSEAKISAGHLYHYFASKEAIIEAMAATGLEHAEERFNHLMKSENPIEGLIAEIEQANTQSCTAQQHQIDMRAKKQLHVDMLAEAGRNPAMAEIVNKHSAKIRGMLATLLETAQKRGQIDQALDPDLAAAILLGAMEGVGNMTMRDPELDMKKKLEMLSTLIKRFLTPGSSKEK